jgi:multimeric flavodoxin WrbA
MKVIAINGSPRMEKGNTSLILAPFVDGLREAGADVELFYTGKLTVKPCKGDLSCWIKTPGECFQKDDMDTILPRLIKADVWVFASPVYMDGVTGPLKTLIDRMGGLLVEPFLELRDGHSRHVPKKGTKGGKVVCVANSGFWEVDNFQSMVAYFEAFCRNTLREFAGALIRPHGQAMRFGPAERVAEVRDAAREAGKQLVSLGRMDAKTLDAVSQELVSLSGYIEFINHGFDEILHKRNFKI